MTQQLNLLKSPKLSTKRHIMNILEKSCENHVMCVGRCPKANETAAGRHCVCACGVTLIYGGKVRKWRKLEDNTQTNSLWPTYPPLFLPRLPSTFWVETGWELTFHPNPPLSKQTRRPPEEKELFCHIFKGLILTSQGSTSLACLHITSQIWLPKTFMRNQFLIFYL